MKMHSPPPRLEFIPPIELVLPDVTVLGEASDDGAKLRPSLRKRWLLSEELLCGHILNVGRTGAGKSTRFLLPLAAAALKTRATVIALDVGLNLTPTLIQMARAAGRPPESIHYVNFQDSASLSWNPL